MSSNASQARAKTKDEITSSQYAWGLSKPLSDFSGYGVVLKGTRREDFHDKALEFIPVASRHNQMIITKVKKIRDHLYKESHARKISIQNILLFDDYFSINNFGFDLAGTALESLEGEYHVLVFDYAKGENLNDWVDNRNTLLEKDVALVGKNLLRGIRELHKARIIHTQLHPSRILFMEEANKYQYPDTAKDLKISNMRNAVSFRKGEGTEHYDELEPDISVNHAGTFEYVDYLSPEVTGNASQGEATVCKLTTAIDIFSAGMIIAEMFGVSPPGHRLTKEGAVRPLTDHDVCDLAGCCPSCRENWKKISKKGREVIKELTNANYKERPSAQEAVKLVAEWIDQLREDERQQLRDERRRLQQEELRRQHKVQRSKKGSENGSKGGKVHRRLTLRYGSGSGSSKK